MFGLAKADGPLEITGNWNCKFVRQKKPLYELKFHIEVIFMENFLHIQ